jgi:hypothetical protein
MGEILMDEYNRTILKLAVALLVAMAALLLMADKGIW